MNRLVEHSEYICPAGVLRPGVVFHARGGPYYVLADGTRTSMAEKGPFRFLRFCIDGQRRWIEAWGKNGFCVLNLSEYESKVPGLVTRPYRVTRVVGAKAMKTSDVRIGGVYYAKVTGKVVPVRIDAARTPRGWYATNLKTGKRIYIKTAQRLRGVARPEDAAPKKQHENATGSPTLACNAPAKTKAGKTTSTQSAATRAKQGAAKRTSGLDAAARVLTESGRPMSAKEIVETAFEKGYWHSAGRTPHATIYAAMIREIAAKGKDSRFRKVDRGRFVANAAAVTTG